jgi:DNA invertase Pin-like site-specific DNA recombinase
MATRTGIYTRVSFTARRSGARTPEQEDSTERQEQRCRAFCTAQSWDVVEVYSDSGISAFKDRDRPAWRRMEQDITEGKLDRVVFFAVSRAGRNAAKLLAFVELCRQHGVEVASATEPIDTGSSFGPVILALLAAIAQMESQTKSERTKSKHVEMAQAGRYVGSYRPFGYTRNMEQVPVEVEAIRRGAEMYLNGATLAVVAKDWNDAGLTTTPGNAWTVTTVRRVFENPIICGTRVHAGKNGDGNRGTGVEYRGAWAPILTKGTFRKLVARFAENAERQMPRRSEKYLLTGLLVCGICGTRLVGHPTAGKRRYACLPSQHLGIAAQPVEQYVGDMASLMLVKRTPVRDPAQLSAPLLAELDDVDGKLAAWYANAAAAGVDADGIRDGARALVADRDRITSELERLAEKPTAEPLLFKADSVEDLRAGIYSPEWAAMIAARVDHVEVAPTTRGSAGRVPVDQRVRITWRDGVIPAPVDGD